MGHNMNELKTRFCCFYYFINPKNESDYRIYFFQQAQDFFTRQMIVALVVSVIMLVYSIVCCVGALDTLNSGVYIVLSG